MTDEEARNPIATWVTKPTVLLVVDETRIPRPEGGEFVFFNIVSTTTVRGHEWMEEVFELRSKLQKPKASLKGRDLFGSEQRPTHEPLRAFVDRCASEVPAIELLLTTNTALTDTYKTITGHLKAQRADDPDAPPRPVLGRELMPLLSAIRAVVKDRHKEPDLVTVVVDRSAQLGLSPSQAGLGEGQFEGFEGTLKDGERTTYKIISASDETPLLQDLLLVPDAFGYLLKREMTTLMPLLNKLSTEPFRMEPGVRVPRRAKHVPA